MTRPQQEAHAAHCNRNEERHGEQRPGPSERRQPPPALTPHYETSGRPGRPNSPISPRTGCVASPEGVPEIPTSTAIKVHRPQRECGRTQVRAHYVRDAHRRSGSVAVAAATRRGSIIDIHLLLSADSDLALSVSDPAPPRSSFPVGRDHVGKC